MASFAEDTIETAALGRPFRLGMLYDCRKDALIPGVTLWKREELKNNTEEHQQQNTEFNITASDSIDEKSNSLNVSGSLKLSLLGGLVDVAGSAKYFQDTKKSHKQQRLTLQYKTTTKFEALSMSHVGRGQVSHPNVFEDDTATHVVTAILYGASAYFMFDRESSNNEDKKQVEGEAKLLMDKLKFLKINADASFDMDKREKSAVENFCCTFHGDVQLPSNPSSLREAVDYYKDLPTLIGKNGEDAVPVKVWLYPLVKLDSKAAKLQRDISTSLIERSSEVIEHLNETEMKCNDLLKDTAATFNAMEEKIETFMQNCHQYKLEFVQKLGSVLPSIRGGGKEESALEDILKAHEKSPFNSKDLDQWLTQKENESDTVNSLLKQLQKLGAKIEDNLDDLLSDLDITNIVSFTFTSIEQPDRSLMKQSHFLSPAGMMSQSPDSDTPQIRNTDWLYADTRQNMKKQLQLFGKLMKLANSDDTKFIVASKHNERYPGACIFLYEDGSDKPVPFTPPSKPASPTTCDSSCDRLSVGVSGPDSATVEYRVEFRKKQETEWTSYPVQEIHGTVLLSGLKPETEHEIRVTAVGKRGYAVSSDVVTAVTKALSPPINVKVTQVKANSITLTWSSPEQYEDLKQYIIEYKEENSDWHKDHTRENVNIFTLKNLKSNTTYCIRMCTDADEVMSKPSQEIKIKTMKQTPHKDKLTVLPGTPPVYLLKMKTGPGQVNNPSNKTIMLVGVTGSGKTTLINAMANYILGVDWKDNWRYKLIDEENHKSQAHSQTSEVTAYQIHHEDDFQIPYSITIIDTPGIGNTRGIKQDEEIKERIRQFFLHSNSIDSIDAVCFVVQAALARLTSTQRYIFNSILSVFGKNIVNNIITLVTFADNQHPPVLEAIKEANIPCATQADGIPVHFKFNNSVLFANNTGCSNGEVDFDYMYWQIGQDSMHRFFTQLGTMETQSLTLTKQVLQKRNHLEEVLKEVQQLIGKESSIMEEMNARQTELDNHKKQMKQNEDFESVLEIKKSQHVPTETGKFVTNCHTCNFTCHYPCSTSHDTDKGNCSVMANGKCTVCPGKCVWSVHFNNDYRWEITLEEEKRIHQDLKDKYEEAMREMKNTEKIVSDLEEEHRQVQRKVVEVMENITECLQDLKEIALRPDPLSTPDYIDLLIESQKQEAKPGFHQRIQELHDVREDAILVQQVVEKITTEVMPTCPFKIIDYL
ncbi:verrucotoxin subunit beta-like [Engraulis encrasicolus]|uniref:verrucotoxin subunit beta-like n=1 Tax=Engraulis encrasicolus TaxID=184585 RepID=UPI002FD3DB6F